MSIRVQTISSAVTWCKGESLTPSVFGQRADCGADCTPAHGSRASSFPAWQRERAGILRGYCLSIERAQARGGTVVQAASYLSKFCRNRFYRTEPKRRVRLSAQTIRTAFYKRQRSGGTAAALQLGYRNERAGWQFSTRQAARVQRLLLHPGTVSLAQVYRAIFKSAPRRPSQDRFYELFTAQERRQCHRMFLARLAYGRAERAFARAIQGKEIGA